MAGNANDYHMVASDGCSAWCFYTVPGSVVSSSNYSEVVLRRVDHLCIGGLDNFVVGDFNRDGVIDAADIADYTAALAQASPAADVNRDLVVDTADAATFFAAWSNAPQP